MEDGVDTRAFLASEQGAIEDGAILPPPRNGIGIGIRAEDGIVVGRAEDRSVRLVISTEERGVRVPSGASLSICTVVGVKEARKEAGSVLVCRCETQT